MAAGHFRNSKIWTAGYMGQKINDAFMFPARAILGTYQSTIVDEALEGSK